VARYTPEHLQAEFAAIGSAAALLFERILAAAEHREQAVRAGLGLLRLGGTHGAGRLEQACQAALEANVKAFVDALTRAKPSGAKGTYVKRISLSSTMGPGFKIDPASLNA